MLRMLTILMLSFGIWLTAQADNARQDAGAVQPSGDATKKQQVAQPLKTEDQAANAALMLQVTTLIDAGRLDEAKAYAMKNDIDFEKLFDQHQRTQIERQRQQQQRKDFERQRQQMAKQRGSLEKQRDTLHKRQSEQRTQREVAISQRSSHHTYQDSRVPLSGRSGTHSAPEYVPSAGRWCENRHGVISCWK